MRQLRSHAWPGNVRELINTIERAAALAEHDMLTSDDFGLGEASARVGEFLDAATREDLSLSELEALYIQRIMAKTGGHKANAAKILGLDRRTLYRKVSELRQRPRLSFGLDGAERDDPDET